MGNGKNTARRAAGQLFVRMGNGKDIVSLATVRRFVRTGNIKDGAGNAAGQRCVLCVNKHFQANAMSQKKRNMSKCVRIVSTKHIPMKGEFQLDTNANSTTSTNSLLKNLVGISLNMT